MEYLTTVVKEVGCRPVYWTRLNISLEDVPLCNATEQYRTLISNYTGYHPTPTIWVEFKWLPCYEMVVSSVLNTKDTDYFTIRVRYQDLGSRYFETINTKDFGFETWWSTVGGIVGIFLGYSIIELFEMISNGLAWINKKLCEKGICGF